jgi:hypothetical protein
LNRGEEEIKRQSEMRRRERARERGGERVGNRNIGQRAREQIRGDASE